MVLESCKHSLQHLVIFKDKSKVKNQIFKDHLHFCLEESHLAIKELNMHHSLAV